MYKNLMRFNKNKKLVIMQVSDAQDLQIVRRTMVKMLNKAYDIVKPDMVVFTGDNILGNHLDDAIFGNRKVVFKKEDIFKRMQKALSHILRPLDKRKIPFAFLYGNHDDMNPFTKREQAEIYKNYEYCIPFNETDERIECDTYNIPIYSSTSDEISYNIWMMDSAGHDDSGENGFEYVSRESVEWYLEQSEALKRQNKGDIVNSIMFQHIPVPEVLELLTECPKSSPNSVENESQSYTLNSKISSGLLGEYPHPCSENFGQFESVMNQGDVRAIAFGHDHLNCFEGNLNGIGLIQTPCTSFRCYGNRSRGVRVFEIDENDTKIYKTYTLSYFDICGNGIISKLRNIFDADDKVREKYLLLSSLIAAFGIIVAVMVKIF